MPRKYEICATLVFYLIVFLSLQFFFDYVAMICASQENGERKFSGFRVQLDGMQACNKIAVKWMVLWELAHV